MEKAKRVFQPRAHGDKARSGLVKICPDCWFTTKPTRSINLGTGYANPGLKKQKPGSALCHPANQAVPKIEFKSEAGPVKLAQIFKGGPSGLSLDKPTRQAPNKVAQTIPTETT